jgi:segregation and condensation protein B
MQEDDDEKDATAAADAETSGRVTGVSDTEPRTEVGAVAADTVADDTNTSVDAGEAPALDEGGAEPAEEALAWSDAELRAVLEALVFASPHPITPRQIADVLGGVPKEAWQRGLEELKADYGREGRGLQLIEIAGGYQITTRPEYNDSIRELLDPKTPTRLSIQALETLAVIAYKQPVTLPEIIELRGVKSGGVLKTLLERRLIRITGRKEVVGRPILYGTTKEFLLHFGLRDLGELPKIEEFAEVLGEEVDVAGLKKAIEAPRPVEVPLTEDEAREATEEDPIEPPSSGSADPAGRSDAPDPHGASAEAEDPDLEGSEDPPEES